MPDLDILKQIPGDEADPTELEQLLLSYYGHGNYPDDGTAVFGSADTPALRT